MRRHLYPFVLLCAAAFSGRAAEPVSFARDVRPFLENYCLKCHDEDRAKGGVDFSNFTNTLSFYQEFKTSEKMADQLQLRTMPPKDKKQPTDEERVRLLGWLTNKLEHPDLTEFPRDPGRTVLHRLNHQEYRNTIRDLLGVEGDFTAQFPSDGSGGGGFDNNAGTLFVPPLLMEKYLAAAESIVAQAKPERLFIARPGGFTSARGAAEKIIRHFVLQGYRRPPEKDEVAALLKLYEKQVAAGGTHEAAVRDVVKAILVSPNFLFRVELDQKGPAPYRVNDFELASRLSYFLWSSMPDAELFRLADRNRLHEPSVLQAQTLRMLRDPRARAFSESFVSQWLRVRELYTSAQPDPNRFPNYSPALRDAMYREPIEVFHVILTNDLPLGRLLDADFTFVNEELARHYGLTNIHGAALQRVTLPDRTRGGIVTMAGPLTLTSYPLRTSPVLRGKWILEEILGTPPPPPPPTVPTLPPDDKPRKGLSFRARLEEHRNNPNCAACHSRMDPLGFGLENFDATGRWRTQIAGQPVDASGQMATGEKFEGPAALKVILQQREGLFTKHLVEKMLAYSLGRGLEYYDLPALQQIEQSLGRASNHSTALLLAIVQSYPFQYRRNEPVPIQAKSL